MTSSFRTMGTVSDAAPVTPGSFSEETHLTERLDDQIRWYDAESQSNQRWFKRLQLVQIILSASIPFVAGFTGGGAAWAQITVGVLGVVVAAIAGVQGLYRFQELWVTYRSTCEVLKRERYLYLARAAPYDEAGAFAERVRRAAHILAAEHAEWTDRTRAATPESGTSSPPSSP